MSENLREEPGQTAAVVVGVGRYAQTDWRLRGVAADARDFAAWLVRRGVEPEHVLLHLSSDDPVDMETLRVDRGGKPPAEVCVLRATKQELRRSFMDIVRGWAECGEIGLLVIFWAGHGYLNDDWRRLLESEESRAAVRQALHLDSLLMAMLCPPFPRLQVAFIDACAIQGRRVDPGNRPGYELFGVGEIDVRIHQFVLYSQRIGVKAPNRRGEDERSFYYALHQELIRADGPGGGLNGPIWPPNMPVIAEGVRAYFRALAGAKKATQTPVFHCTGWDGSCAVDPEIYADHPSSPGRTGAIAPVDPKHRDQLAKEFRALGPLGEPSHREALLRSLQAATFTQGLNPAEGDEFFRGLAVGLLARPPDLGRLLEAIDRLPALRDHLRPQGEIFGTLDRLVNVLPFRWTEVADLRRLIERPGAETVLREVKVWLFDEFLNDVTVGSLAERVKASAGMGTSSLLLHLATLTGEPSEAPPLLRLACLAEAKANGQLRADLGAWVDSVVGRLKVPRPALRGAKLAADEPGPVRMMVVVERINDVRGERFSVRTYLDERGLPREDTPGEHSWTRDMIAELIHQTLRKKEGPCEVELFLEEDLLAEGVGGWTVRVDAEDRDPIDTLYPVRLRSWDRYDPAESSDFDERVLSRWRERWEELPGPGGILCAAHLAELHAPHDYGRGLREMLRRSGPLCLAASLIPPGSGTDARSPRQTLHSFLVAGTPIALWPAPARAPVDGADRCAVRVGLREFVLNQHSDRLPRLVSDRRDTLGTDPDPLRHLCLLWDDPHRGLPNEGEMYPSPGYAEPSI